MVIRSTRWASLAVASCFAATLAAACGPLSSVLPQSAGDPGTASTTAQTNTVAVGTAVSATPRPGARANAANTVTVRRDSITETTSLDGVVVPQDQITVTYPTKGTVDEIRVKPGQAVKQGDLLVNFNPGELSRALEAARTKLQTSQANLAQGQAAQQAAAQRAATNAQLQQQAVLDAEAGVKRAQENLARVQAGRTASERQAQETAVSYGNAQLQEAQNQLARLLAGPDDNAVRAAQRDITANELALSRAQAELDKLTRGPDPDTARAAETALQRAQTQLQIAQNSKPDPRQDPAVAKLQHDQSVQDAQNAVFAAQAALVKLKEPPGALDVKTARQKVQDTQDALDASRAKLEAIQNGPDQAAINAVTTNIEHIKHYLGEAQANLDEVRSHPTPAELADAQDVLRKAQSALDSARRGSPADAGAPDLQALQNAIKQDQTDVARLELAMNNTHLTSPIDGVVVALRVKEGETISSQKPVLVLAKPGAPLVRVDLADGDETQLAIGQPAHIAIDTGRGQPTVFDAVVKATTSAAADGGRSATFDVSWPDGEAPKFNTPVAVNIDVHHKDGVLVLPKNALRQSGGRSMVQLQDGNLRRLVPVQVGITAADRVEIVSGLSEGQSVLLGTF